MVLPKLYMALALARVRDHMLELAGAGMPLALLYRAATEEVGIGSVYVRKPARLRIAPFTSPILGNFGALRGIQRLPSEGIRTRCNVSPGSPFRTVFESLIGA